MILEIKIKDCDLYPSLVLLNRITQYSRGRRELPGRWRTDRSPPSSVSAPKLSQSNPFFDNFEIYFSAALKNCLFTNRDLFKLMGRGSWWGEEPKKMIDNKYILKFCWFLGQVSFQVFTITDVILDWCQFGNHPLKVTFRTLLTALSRWPTHFGPTHHSSS